MQTADLETFGSARELFVTLNEGFPARYLFLRPYRYCGPGCGHEFLLDSLLSNVGRDVNNLDFHISAAPKALLKFEDSVRGNMARTIPAFT